MAIGALSALLLWLDRLERRRRREWHRDYYHRGGLIRALMRNWRGTLKLTDERSRDDKDEPLA